MKIQRIALTVIAIFFLTFFLFSLAVEFYSFQKDNEHSLTEWLLLRSENTESDLNNNMPGRTWFYEFRGRLNLFLDKHYVYGIYKFDNGHLVTLSARVALDNKFNNIEAFHGWCSEHDIPLLYVNLPSKNENRFLSDYGVKSFAGENADNLLAFLAEKGIDHLDMRNYLKIRCR